MLKISTIIPHAGGREILRDCLNSLYGSQGVGIEAIIVVNGPVDDVDDLFLKPFPDVQVLRYPCNIGFAAACNRGVEAASNDLVFLLNNDATVEPGTIRILAEWMSRDDSVFACQPKILSLVHPGSFDYSSACGGELDRYGFPFARGRVFDTLEEDRGQYDTPLEVFWGAGAALMLRRDKYLEAGGLDEKFFAHMEEIDLQWRLRLMGGRVIAYPEAVAYHRGAVTIRTGSFRKLYLNHRNSLATVFRNYEPRSLLRVFPVRMALDLSLMAFSALKLDFVRFWAVLRAGLWFWVSLPYLIKMRTRIKQLRKLSDDEISGHLFPKSVAWQYYIHKRRVWSELRAVHERDVSR